MRLQWLVFGILGSGCELPDEEKGTPTDLLPAPPLTGDTGTEPEVDADKDGFVASQDCDDTDPSINPDALELCDGLDNNCTDVADDGPGVASIVDDAGGTLYKTLDEAIAAAVEVPGTTVDVCAGDFTVARIELDADDQLTLRGVSGRDETVLRAVSRGTLVDMTGDATLTVEGITVTDSGNRAFVLDGESVLTLLDSRVDANPGGGVLIVEDANGVDLTIQGTMFTNNIVPSFGGAILAEGRAFDIVIEASKQSSSSFSNNQATRGGAIALVNRPGAQLASRALELRGDLSFSGNQATESGGAIYSVLGTWELEQVVFEGNTASDFGGAVDLINSAMTMADATLQNNTAAIGGAVSMDVFGFSALEGTGNNVALIENVALEVGGAVAGGGFLSGLVIARNEAALGGGLHVPSGAFMTLEASTVDANQAIQGAGVFLESDSDVDMVDAVFTLNEAIPEFPPATKKAPLPPLPEVVEPAFAGLGGAAFLNDRAMLQATTSSFGIDDSDSGGINNDNQPGDVFIRALGLEANHEALGLDVSVLCTDDGCLLVQAP
ncbi:MAG: MopE-related protein [Myxococcota bacterium]